MIYAEHQAVQGPPDHEGPARAVPGPADEHGQEEIPVLLEPSGPVAAQGNVQKVAQPGAERDVPAPPEIHDARGFIG